MDIGLVGNLMRGRSFYDAARNRGHFALASWPVLESYSKRIAKENLANKIRKKPNSALNGIEAKDIAWYW